MPGPRRSGTWYRSLTNPENRKAFVTTMRSVIDPGGQSVSAMDRLYLAAHMPTLIVWGDRDTIIPVVHAYKVHEAIPNSRLSIMEGVGHFPHAEEPARFVENPRGVRARHRTEPLHTRADARTAAPGTSLSRQGSETGRRNLRHHGEELGMAAAALGDDQQKGGENVWSFANPH